MLTALKGSQYFAESLRSANTPNILCAVRAGSAPRTSPPHNAGVAELVDAPDSKSGFFGSGGSIPPLGTTYYIRVSARFLIIFGLPDWGDFASAHLPRSEYVA